MGSFKKIADLLSEDVGYAKFSNGCGTGCDSLAIAEYALETGNFNHVELNWERARIKAESKAQTSVMICSRFTLIRYYLLEGKLSKAAEMIQFLEQVAAKLNSSLINTSVDLCKGYFYANLNQPEKIPAWLQTGDIQAAYHLLGMNASVPLLQKVLDEAIQDQIIMPFIEAAPHISEMLLYISRQDPDNEFINCILSYCYKYTENLRSINNGFVPLSPRELEILTLLDEGLSRKQIAEKLFISQETAKTHIKNIYQKLQVSSKVSAINIAKRWGYLA